MTTRRRRFILAIAAVVLFLSSTALLLHSTSSSSSWLLNYYSHDRNYFFYDTTDAAAAANDEEERERLDYLLGVGAQPLLRPSTIVSTADASDDADNEEGENGQSTTIIVMNNATIINADATTNNNNNNNNSSRASVRRRKKGQRKRRDNDDKNPYSNRGAIMSVLKSRLDPNIVAANPNTDDDKIYAQHRPRRDPKGVKWLGWSTTMTPTPTDTHDDDDDSAKKNNGKNHGDNRQQRKKDSSGSSSSSSYWWRQSKYCFEIDHICHYKTKNEWFYYPSSSSSSSSFQTREQRQQRQQLLLQPNMELKSAPYKYDGHSDVGDVRIYINLDSTSSSSISKSNDRQFHYNNMEEKDGEQVVSFTVTNENKQNNYSKRNEKKHKKKKEEEEKKCYVSSTPTHVVLQSVFNDMIGEFYTRTLLGVYNMMKNAANANATDAPTMDDENNDKLLPWEDNIQFYIHIAYGNKNMLDGHVLLLNGLLSNNTTTPLSFLDLFVNNIKVDDDLEEEEEEGDDNIDDENDDDCQCYQKMVFCGYDVYMHDNNIQSKDIEPEQRRQRQQIQQQQPESNEGSIEDSTMHTSTNYDPATKYTLWSSSSTWKTIDICKSVITGMEYECLDWYNLRSHMATNFITNYPTLSQDVSNRRRQYLLQVGRITTAYQGDTKEYTIIGLTQRTYRRAWLNLPTIVEKCNILNNYDGAAAITTTNLKEDRRRSSSVICVEINVETTTSPYDQLLLHQSLDAIIGVHGAQLTQAILLPKHGHVLELLPWIPNYIRGDWTARTHAPTPLGIIFHNTDINHVGLSLTRESVPLCEGVAKEEEEACFLRDRKKFIWDNRDFTVNADAILLYIEKFVLLYNYNRETINNSLTCDELQYNLDDRFVMYNVWCTRSSSSSSQSGNNNSTVSAVWHNYHNKPK